MNISDALYTYGIKDKKLDRILRKIARGKRMRRLYVVVLPLVRDGLLEIYVYNQLLQPFYKRFTDSIHVVGVALDKAGAEELVLRMVQDMYDVGDGAVFDAVRFFKEA